MKGKLTRKYAISASALPAALLLFLFSSTLLNAQSVFANLGPASFSKNWDTTSRSNPYVPQVAQQRSAYPARASVALISQGPMNPVPELPGSVLTQPTVPGRRAVVRHGIAYAPQEAPLCVKKAIWAINTIHTKPYVWGGGHDSFFDRGYDCSGTVSFALHYAGLLGSPTDSRGLMNFGEPGAGHWMTVFARNGHTWMIIAGLRLDTSDLNGSDEGPRWRAQGRTSWGFVARHPVGL